MSLKKSSYLMNKQTGDHLSLFVFIVVMVPLSLFWHELGHVIGGKLVRATHITVTLGLGKPLFRLNVGNMTFDVRRIFFVHSLTETKKNDSLSKREIVIVSMMGPLNSLVFGLCFYAVHQLAMPSFVIYLMFLFNIWIGIINLLPFKWKSRHSDGYAIVKALFFH